MIPWALTQVLTQKANIVLIAPVWKTQAWFPALLLFQSDYPILIPARDTMIPQVNQLPLPVRGLEVQLATWPISGDPAKLETFQMKQACWKLSVLPRPF